MTDAEAIAILKTAESDSSLREVARRIGLESHSALSRFLSGKRVIGKNRQLIMDFVRKSSKMAHDVPRETSATPALPSTLTTVHGAPVNATLAAGQAELALWLRHYTARVLRAQADALDGGLSAPVESARPPRDRTKVPPVKPGVLETVLATNRAGAEAAKARRESANRVGPEAAKKSAGGGR